MSGLESLRLRRFFCAFKEQQRRRRRNHPSFFLASRLLSVCTRFASSRASARCLHRVRHINYSNTGGGKCCCSASEKLSSGRFLLLLLSSVMLLLSFVSLLPLLLLPLEAALLPWPHTGVQHRRTTASQSSVLCSDSYFFPPLPTRSHVSTAPCLPRVFPHPSSCVCFVWISGHV